MRRTARRLPASSTISTVNLLQPNWGEGTTSSSDGQRFRAGGRGEQAGQVNLRYGTKPGVLFYTHVSDQYAPLHTKMINAAVRDATHVLDGLLYHESELQIEEHYTDAAGFTDHVFALCHLLGFRFAPRIRHIGQTRLFSTEKPSRYPTLERLIGEPLTPSKSLRIGTKSCDLPHPSNRVPSPPRSCFASLAPIHVKTRSLWPYGKSVNWNAHHFC